MRALITGITGQDGAYLAKLLLAKGYEVVGAVRRVSSVNTARLSELGILSDVRLVGVDLFEFGNVLRLVEATKADEIYNLAAQSFVGVSFEQPTYTMEIVGLGVVRLLEAIRIFNPKTRFYQASTSEMYGRAPVSPQNEATRFDPCSPYGIAKLYAHQMCAHYRHSFGMHITSGIAFNHESPLRGIDFVTRKITVGLARVKLGELDCLKLGNLEARRDWGYAPEYVEGMWRMLQQKEPADYVLATGRAHSVEDACAAAGQAMGMELVWEGEGLDREGRDRRSNRPVVKVDPAFLRPNEIYHLVGDAAKAATALGWSARTGFETIMSEMAEADLRRVRDDDLRF